MSVGTPASLPPSAQPSRVRTVRRAQDPSSRDSCPLPPSCAVLGRSLTSPSLASSRLHREEEGGKEEEEEEGEKKEEEWEWG